MSSQASRQRKIIDAYEANPDHDPKVLDHMKYINGYANIIDDDAIKTAAELLSPANSPSHPTNSIEDANKKAGN